MMYLMHLLCALIYVKCVQSTNGMTSDGMTSDQGQMSQTGMTDEDPEVTNLQHEDEVDFLEVQEKQRFKRLTNNPDPELKDLWHLTNDVVTYPLNIEQAWAQGYTGKGVIVAVIDSLIQTNHSDLEGNVDVADSYDYYNDVAHHNPPPGMNRGTAVAGFIAGVKGNNFCSVGVSYNATIIVVGLYGAIFIRGFTDILLSKVYSHNSSIVDIYFMGPSDDHSFRYLPMGPLTKAAIESAVANGRGGKGCIYVSEAGSQGPNSNSNTAERQALIYTISITSVKDTASVYYGEFGANIMAAAYGGTYRDRYLTSIEEGNGCAGATLYQTEYATAIATGIIALALEANPDLTWRDVQHLIARTSRRYALTNDYGHLTYPWQRNGRGFYVHPKFGFGLMNAEGMVNMAKIWRTVATQHIYNTAINTQEIISTNGVYGEDVISVPVRDQPIRFLEHVTATVALNYTGERGLVEINVISPSGLTSPLLTLRHYDFISGGEMSWTFKSVHFWGENPIGNWRLQFRSVQRVAVVELVSWSLTLYGTTTNPRWWRG